MELAILIILCVNLSHGSFQPSVPHDQRADTAGIPDEKQGKVDYFLFCSLAKQAAPTAPEKSPY